MIFKWANIFYHLYQFLMESGVKLEDTAATGDYLYWNTFIFMPLHKPFFCLQCPSPLLCPRNLNQYCLWVLDPVFYDSSKITPISLIPCRILIIDVLALCRHLHAVSLSVVHVHFIQSTEPPKCYSCDLFVFLSSSHIVGGPCLSMNKILASI